MTFHQKKGHKEVLHFTITPTWEYSISHFVLHKIFYVLPSTDSSSHSSICENPFNHCKHLSSLNSQCVAARFACSPACIKLHISTSVYSKTFFLRLLLFGSCGSARPPDFHIVVPEIKGDWLWINQIKRWRWISHPAAVESFRQK